MSRPRAHFTPTSGWVNDPYGVTWHGGRYHLFFQHAPDAVVWGPDLHWGHAVSTDLVHWTEQPVALSPGEGDEGIWSGSVVTDEAGAGHLFYTSVQLGALSLGTVSAAHPVDEDWQVWRKDGAVVLPPDDLDLVEFRDPYVLHDGTRWRMVLGGGTADGNGLALSWTSPDLEAWAYDGVLASRHTDLTDPVWTGSAWECPQLFRLGDEWVLLFSVWEAGVTRFEAYAVGDLVDGRFAARTWRRFSYGPAPYAGSTFTDAEGRRCLVHWLREVADPDGQWAGAHSVPHVLHLEGDRLVAAPHPNVAALATPLAPDAHEVIGDATLTLTEEVLTVRRGPDSFTMPCSGGPVQVLVDGSVVEVFGPDGIAGFAISP